MSENTSGEFFDFAMPKFEETSESAILLKWLKHPGDAVAEGEAIAEVETEKFTHPLESPVTGELAEHLCAEGDDVDVGVLIARFRVEG